MQSIFRLHMETPTQPLPPLTLPARGGPEGFRPHQAIRLEHFGGSEVNGSAFSVLVKGGGGFAGPKMPEPGFGPFGGFGGNSEFQFRHENVILAFNVPLPIPPHLESTRSFGEMPLPMHFGIPNDPKFMPLHQQGSGGFRKPSPPMTLPPLNPPGGENPTNPPLKVRIKMPPGVALPVFRTPEEDPDIQIIEPPAKPTPEHKTALQRALEDTNDVPESKAPQTLSQIFTQRVPEPHTQTIRFKTTCDAFVTSQPLPEDPSLKNTVVASREAVREAEKQIPRGSSALLDALRLPPSPSPTIQRLSSTPRCTDSNNNKKGHQKLLYKEMRYLRTSITQLQQKVQIQSISHIKEKESWEESDKQKSLAIEVALNKISKLEAENKVLKNSNKELKQKIENQKTEEGSLKRKSINDVADLLKKKRETQSPEENQEAEVIKTFLASQTNPFKGQEASEPVTSLKDIPPVFPLILPNLILVPEGPIPGYSEKHLKKLHAAQKRCFYAPAYKYPNIAKRYLFWYNRILGLPQVCEKVPSVNEIRMQLLEESVVVLEQWPSTRIDSEARMMKALIDEEYEEQLRKGWVCTL